jgi:hypothetical protein
MAAPTNVRRTTASRSKAPVSRSRTAASRSRTAASRSKAAAPRSRGAAARPLTDAQTAELIELVKGADSVELKLTVPVSDHRATIVRLGIDALEAQIRHVIFFDTPDLALNAAGVVVRARRIQGGRGDSVIKLRPVVPADLPADLRKSGSLGVEVDVIPGGFVCSASLKGKSSAAEIRATTIGGKSIRRLFTKQQRAFFAEHAPAGIELDGLTALGPTFVLKVRITPAELGRPLVGELWLYPDGSRILELSTKCPPSQMFQVAGECRAFLTGRGVRIAGGQQTKTKTALEYFSREARQGGSA